MHSTDNILQEWKEGRLFSPFPSLPHILLEQDHSELSEGLMCASVHLHVWLCVLLALCAHTCTLCGKNGYCYKYLGEVIVSSQERRITLPLILYLVA